MKRNRDEAFVLDTRDLGDADLIVILVTENHGTVRAVGRSARRSRRRFGGWLEPLTRVRATWTEREGRELHRLDGMDGVRSFAAMQADPVIQAACAVLAELAAAFGHEGQADPQTFRLLGAVLDALEAGGPAGPLLRYYEYWTLRLHGLLPDLASCFACGKVLPAGRTVRATPGQGARCADCPRPSGAQEVRLGRAERSSLDLLRRVPPASLVENMREARGGRALESWLRRTLEAFAERRFRTYRHFKAAEGLTCDGGRR